MKKSVFLFLAFVCSFSFAQEALKSLEEEYYDFLSLTGKAARNTLGYRTLSDSVWNVEEEHVWKNNNLGSVFVLKETSSGDDFFTRGIKNNLFLKVYGPEWFNSVNTGSPYGQNDGALWQGKGYNTSLTGGVRFEGFGFETIFKPQISFSQNLDYNYNEGVYGNSGSYFWKGNIDLVQRYGEDALFTFDWGDSEIRWSWYNFTIGFGTQSPWLGPAWLNPMLGSNNAASYPKIDFGLRKQKIVIPGLEWNLGYIEGRVWMGRLEQSDYFEVPGADEYRQITGFNVSWSPSFLPGLTVGGTKICFNDWTHKSLLYINPFYDTNNQEVQEDQKMSLYADWIVPAGGIEVYGEIGKDDYSIQEWANPFHTAIYTVGVKKTVPVSRKHNIHGEILFEWSNFEASQDFQIQWKYMGYYAHGGVKQGYTQKGQILGAGTGYFGNSQFLGFNLYYPKGNTLFLFHRHCPDNNYNYEKTAGGPLSGDDLNSNGGYYDGTAYNKYWSHYKTYRTFGFCTNYFVTDSLCATLGLDYMWIYFPNNDNSIMGEDNFHIYGGLKYNF